MKQKIFFNENEYDKLYPSGSAPARIYGTPKMHKFSPSDSFPKLRPIVSSIGTFNYNPALFLCDLLSPLVPNDYSCKDTFSFVSQIKNANLSKKFLVSYDVTYDVNTMSKNFASYLHSQGSIEQEYLSKNEEKKISF